METMRTKQKLRDEVLALLRNNCEPATGSWEADLGEDGTATFELQGRRLVARVIAETPDGEQETEVLVLEL